jgi:hypothetical protein
VAVVEDADEQYPPICTAAGWIPIKILAVQIWDFCALTFPALFH